MTTASPRPEFIVSAVQFMPNGVELAFMRLPDDIRNEGKLVATRAFSVSYDHPGYEDELRELKEIATDLVKDIYEDFDDAPISLDADEDEGDDDEDEERGMGE